MGHRIGSHFAFVVIVCLVSGSTSPVSAVNRFFFASDPLLTGSTANPIEVRCDHDIEILGYSFALDYDQTKLAVTSVTNSGSIAATAEFFGGMVDVAAGRLGYGCVFEFEDIGTARLPAGTNRLLGTLNADVTAMSNTMTTLTFQDVALPPNTDSPVKNVLTNAQGRSVLPSLEHGMLSIITAAPEIVSLANNSGLPGRVFQVVGNFFDQPGLQVRVCAVVASATLRGDNRTLDVTAPACAQAGCVEVQVCTGRGCDADPMGFCYTAPPGPSITSITPPAGLAGTQVTIRGANLNQTGLLIFFCGLPADHGPPAVDGSSVVATAPPSTPCDPGPADVEVRTDFGSDVVNAGFTYSTPGGGFVRGDADSNGTLELSDGIRILNFLFLGRAAPNCMDAADADDNGTTELTDAVRIFGWLFTGGPAPRAPSPTNPVYGPGECGPDPSADGLDCAVQAPVCSG